MQGPGGRVVVQTRYIVDVVDDDGRRRAIGVAR
jgi:hypothetical protein